MYNFERVRKNAKKKINELLQGSVGIIARSSSMQIDDSFDNSYRISSPGEVLAWLEDDLNYCDAELYFVDEVFYVKGPYHFCDKFEIYYSNEAFKKELELHNLI